MHGNQQLQCAADKTYESANTPAIVSAGGKANVIAYGNYNKAGGRFL
jgi:hypothetical protein